MTVPPRRRAETVRLPLACALLVALTFAASLAGRPADDWRSVVDARLAGGAASRPGLESSPASIPVAALQPRTLPGAERVGGSGVAGGPRRVAGFAALMPPPRRSVAELACDDPSYGSRFRDCGYLSAPPTAPPASV